MGPLHRLARGAWLYVVLVVAVVTLLYLIVNLHGAGLPVLLAAAVVLLGLILLFVAARTPSAGPQPDATTLLTPTLVVQEARAAALVTYGQIGVVTVKKERDKAADSLIKPLRDKLLGEELVMDVGVRIVAGVNLKHLREDDVRVNGKSAQITLPPTKVLMVYVDESLTRVVSYKAGWFSPRDIRMMDTVRREAMEALVNAAIEEDLLDKAGRQAATAVAALARGLGFEQVEVVPTLPPIGAHFEELHDPALLSKVKSESALLSSQLSPVLPREDQAGD